MANTVSNMVQPAERPAALVNPPVQARLPARPVSRLELNGAYAVACLLIGAAAIVTPLAKLAEPAMPGFIVSYMTGLIILDLLVSILLFSKGRVERDRGSILLSAAYLYAAIILVAYMATFPNAFVTGTLLGGTTSSSWLWVFWHAGFAGFILCYAMSHPMDAMPRISRLALLVLLLAGGAIFLSTAEIRHLPKVFGAERLDSVVGPLVVPAVLALSLLANTALALRRPFGRVEDLWLTVGVFAACVDIWLTFCGDQRYTLGWYCGRICGLSTSFVLFVFLMEDVFVKYRSVTVANGVLDRLSLTDALTGLGNRRMFDGVLQTEWRRCRRDGLPLSIVLFDVDNFKAYNDSRGHQAGDICLQRVAVQLRNAASRAADLALRYGGEEFVLILPATDSAGAEYLACQARLMVRDLLIPHQASARKVITVSAGVATLIPSEHFEAEELVRLADLALYRAKAGGRDMVCVAGSD